jgi:hypothetical protein
MGSVKVCLHRISLREILPVKALSSFFDHASVRRSKNSIEYFVGKVNRFIYGVTRRDHADIDLLFPRKPQPGDYARPEVDQGTVRARDGSVWVEHLNVPQLEFASSPNGLEGPGIPRKADTFVAHRRVGR